MSDQTESALSGGEQGNLPGSGASQTDGGQQSSDSPDFDTIVKSLRESDELTSLIDERVERQWQSGKDRRIGQLEDKTNKLDERLGRFAELIEQGRTPIQAQEQLEFEDDRKWLRNYRQEQEGLSSTRTSRGSGGGMSDNVKAVLSQFKVPADNAEVMKALDGKSEAEQVSLAVQIGQRYQASESAIGASAIGTMGSGNPPPSTDLDKEYHVLLETSYTSIFLHRLHLFVNQQVQTKGIYCYQ